MSTLCTRVFRGEGFENSQKRMNQLVVSCIMCEQRSTRRGNVKEHKESHHKDHFILAITAEMNHGGKLVSKLTRGQCTKNSCHSCNHCDRKPSQGGSRKTPVLSRHCHRCMRQAPSSTMSGPLLNLGDSQDRKLAPFLRKNLVVRLETKKFLVSFF